MKGGGGSGGVCRSFSVDVLRCCCVVWWCWTVQWRWFVARCVVLGGVLLHYVGLLLCIELEG